MSTDFPYREGEVITLTQAMIDGLEKNVKEFPNPPIQVENLKSMVNEYMRLRGEALEARSAAEQATKLKDEQYDAIFNASRAVEKYIKIIGKLNNINIKGFGLSEPKKRGTGDVPGQCLSLEILVFGLAWLTLIWKSPSKGASFTHFIIYCRKTPNGLWEVVDTSKDKKANIVNLPANQPLEFKVRAANAAGEGEDSNIIAITL